MAQWEHGNPVTMEDNDENQRMNAIVSTLSILNDTAERGVKDIEDYAHVSEDGDQRDRHHPLMRSR